jgi:enamine deaminase RidA (YjgF/YER057c/UK114 family)
MKILQPAGWARPNGYSNAIEARGRTIYVAGLIGRTPDEVFIAKDLPGQFEQILLNLVELLAEGDAGPEHVVRLTWYITDKQAYLANLKQIGEAYRRIMGRNFPVMAVIQVAALMEDDALIEIEATAVVPD